MFYCTNYLKGLFIINFKPRINKLSYKSTIIQFVYTEADNKKRVIQAKISVQPFCFSSFHYVYLFFDAFLACLQFCMNCFRSQFIHDRQQIPIGTRAAFKSPITLLLSLSSHSLPCLLYDKYNCKGNSFI